MIKNFLTIIIPCKNSIIPVKRTIENLLDKTKIIGTRVLVLDFGSTDGSFQYVAQSSNEYIKILKIESLKMEEGSNIGDIKNDIHTPYIMIINPGSIFKDRDIILSSVNYILKMNNSIVYTPKEKNIINRMGIIIPKNGLGVNALFSKKDLLENIKLDQENPNLIFLKKLKRRDIKIAGSI